MHLEVRDMGGVPVAPLTPAHVVARGIDFPLLHDHTPEAINATACWFLAS